MGEPPFVSGDRVVCIRGPGYGSINYPGFDPVIGDHYTIDKCDLARDAYKNIRWGVSLVGYDSGPYCYEAFRFRKLDDQEPVETRELEEVV